MIKQQSDNIQWYYNGLKPNVHFILVPSDFSNLIETLRWLKSNDEFAKQISCNAQEFAKNNLTRSDFYHYMYVLITKYSVIQSQNEKIL